MQFTLQSMQLACIMASILLLWEAAGQVYLWATGRERVAREIQQIDLAIGGLALALVPVFAFWPRIFRDRGVLDPYMQPLTFNVAGLALFFAMFWLKRQLRASTAKEQRRVMAAVLMVAFASTGVEWGRFALVECAHDLMGG